jgi:hypothetical protein
MEKKNGIRNSSSGMNGAAVVMDRRMENIFFMYKRYKMKSYILLLSGMIFSAINSV